MDKLGGGWEQMCY